MIRESTTDIPESQQHDVSAGSGQRPAAADLRQLKGAVDGAHRCRRIAGRDRE
jgi:hypothetical protein